mmetsp:Transcript_28051/g.94473  ORF Transcript_28051/g.94473 Transcript_28051/m.94473 type:complete len:268 (+) Transcript_28051:274-1077(+)
MRIAPTPTAQRSTTRASATPSTRSSPSRASSATRRCPWCWRGKMRPCIIPSSASARLSRKMNAPTSWKRSSTWRASRPSRAWTSLTSLWISTGTTTAASPPRNFTATCTGSTAASRQARLRHSQKPTTSATASACTSAPWPPTWRPRRRRGRRTRALAALRPRTAPPAPPSRVRTSSCAATRPPGPPQARRRCAKSKKRSGGTWRKGASVWTTRSSLLTPLAAAPSPTSTLRGASGAHLQSTSRPWPCGKLRTSTAAEKIPWIGKRS